MRTRARVGRAMVACAAAALLGAPATALADTTSPTPNPTASSSTSAPATTSAPEASITGLYQNRVAVGSIQPSTIPYDVAWSVDNRQGTDTIVITQVEFGPITTDDADCDPDFELRAPVQVLTPPVVVEAGTVANPVGDAVDPFVQDQLFSFESDELCRDLEVSIPVRIVYTTLKPGQPTPTAATSGTASAPTSAQTSTDPSARSSAAGAETTSEPAVTAQTQTAPSERRSSRPGRAALADTGAPAGIVPLAVLGTLLASAGALALTVGRRR